MTRITLDEALRERLLNLQQPLELCDESGKVVGLVTPLDSGPTEPPLSEEELRRREQEPDYSTAEILDALDKL